MRVTVYGTEADRRELADLLACLPDCSYRNVRVAGFSEYDGHGGRDRRQKHLRTGAGGVVFQ